MIEVAEGGLEQGGGERFFAKFGEQQSDDARRAGLHYLLGLGYLGKGEKAPAHAEFEKAQELDINHVWAARYVKALAR